MRPSRRSVAWLTCSASPMSGRPSTFLRALLSCAAPPSCQAALILIGRKQHVAIDRSPGPLQPTLPSTGRSVCKCIVSLGPVVVEKVKADRDPCNLGLLSIVEQGLTSSDPTDCSPGESDERNVLMKQFSVLVPAKLRHNRCCVLGTHDHHQAQRNKDGEDGHDNNSSPSPTMDNMLNYDSMDGLWQDWSVLEELESAVDAVVPQHSMV